MGYSDIITYAALVNIALKENQLPQAMLNADTLIQTFPDNALSYELKADVCMAQKKPQQAVQFYDLALEKEQLARIIAKRYPAHVKLKGQETLLKPDWIS